MDKILARIDSTDRGDRDTLLNVAKIKITLVFFHKTIAFFKKDIFQSLIPFLFHRGIGSVACNRMLIFPPRRRKYFFFLRSPHVDKKSIESYYFINSKIFFNVFLKFSKGGNAEDLITIIIFHKLLLLNLLNTLRRYNLFLQLRIVYYGTYSFQPTIRTITNIILPHGIHL